MTSARPLPPRGCRLVQVVKDQPGFVSTCRYIGPTHQRGPWRHSAAAGAGPSLSDTRLPSSASTISYGSSLSPDSTAQGLDVWLIDRSTDDLSLWHGTSPGGSAGIFPPPPAKGQQRAQDVLDVAGRRWTVDMLATPAFAATHASRRPQIIFLTSLAITFCSRVTSTLLRNRPPKSKDGSPSGPPSYPSGRCNFAARLLERRRAEDSSRQAEAVARLAEARYRGIFENSVEGMFQTAPDGHYLTANRRWRGSTATNPSMLISDLTNIAGQLYVDLGTARAVRRAGAAGRAAVPDFESQVYRRDGTVIWISENARTVRERRGEMLYYEGTVVDVTARKEAGRLAAPKPRRTGSSGSRADEASWPRATSSSRRKCASASAPKTRRPPPTVPRAHSWRT